MDTSVFRASVAHGFIGFLLNVPMLRPIVVKFMNLTLPTFLLEKKLTKKLHNLGLSYEDYSLVTGTHSAQIIKKYSNRPRSVRARSSDFEITRQISPWIVLHAVQFCLWSDEIWLRRCPITLIIAYRFRLYSNTSDYLMKPRTSLKKRALFEIKSARAKHSLREYVIIASRCHSK